MTNLFDQQTALVQNLKVKAFRETSKNVFSTQIWIALCVYLPLLFLEIHGQVGKLKAINVSFVAAEFVSTEFLLRRELPDTSDHLNIEKISIYILI